MSVETKPVAPVKFTIKDYKSDLHNDWCPGCVAPDSRIVMADGSSRRIADVVAGDRVLGHDGQPHAVLAATSHHHDDTMRRITVSGHGELTITRDHPMFIVRRAAVLQIGAKSQTVPVLCCSLPDPWVRDRVQHIGEEVHCDVG